MLAAIKGVVQGNTVIIEDDYKENTMGQRLLLLC